ncbi:MAG: DUF2147 domain-containing protein [Hellea sp.]
MKLSFWLILSLFVSVPAGASPHDVFGLWASEAKDGHVEISDCGNGTPCGVLVWVDPEKGGATLDVRNNNKDLRKRPLIGVPIIWNFQRSKKGWRSGRIYNPEDGKVFTAHVRRQDENHLKVKGCLAVVCITNIWTRLPSSAETVTPSTGDSKDD